MMKVNQYWERVETLSDISRVIREHYNSELADKMDELIDNTNKNVCYRDKQEMEDRIIELESVIEEIQGLVRYL